MSISVGDTVIVKDSTSPFYGRKFEVSRIVPVSMEWRPMHVHPGTQLLVYVFDDENYGRRREIGFEYDDVEKVTTERMWPKTNPFIATNSHSSIKRVIFNPPATIVLWSDGSKTVVKANGGDAFDPEKGLAMAISKKALGNKGNYYNVFKRFIPAKTIDWDVDLNPNMTISEAIEKCAEALKKAWGIE